MLTLWPLPTPFADLYVWLIHMVTIVLEQGCVLRDVRSIRLNLEIGRVAWIFVLTFALWICMEMSWVTGCVLITVQLDILLRMIPLGCVYQSANLEPMGRTDGVTPILSTVRPIPLQMMPIIYVMDAVLSRRPGVTPQPRDVWHNVLWIRLPVNQ